MLALIACGGGSSAPGPSPTIAFRTPATAAPGSTPSPASSPSASSGPATSLTVVAKNTLLDSSALKAAPGSVTITFMNQDAGTVHNFHIYKGPDQNGTSVGQTDFKAGPVTDTLTVALAAGTYHYQCDVHPDQMNGTLTVG